MSSAPVIVTYFAASGLCSPSLRESCAHCCARVGVTGPDRMRLPVDLEVAAHNEKLLSSALPGSAIRPVKAGGFLFSGSEERFL